MLDLPPDFKMGDTVIRQIGDMANARVTWKDERTFVVTPEDERYAFAMRIINARTLNGTTRFVLAYADVSNTEDKFVG